MFEARIFGGFSTIFLSIFEIHEILEGPGASEGLERAHSAQKLQRALEAPQRI